jgi:hypothetical protein
LKWGRIPEAEEAFKRGLDLWDNVDVFKNSARLWSEATGESEAAGLRQILPRERFALWPILLQALGREGAWDDLAEEAQAYLQAVGMQDPQAQEDVIYAYASQGQREKGLQVLERIRSGVLPDSGAR